MCMQEEERVIRKERKQKKHRKQKIGWIQLRAQR